MNLLKFFVVLVIAMITLRQADARPAPARQARNVNRGHTQVRAGILVLDRFGKAMQLIAGWKVFSPLVDFLVSSKTPEVPPPVFEGFESEEMRFRPGTNRTLTDVIDPASGQYYDPGWEWEADFPRADDVVELFVMRVSEFVQAAPKSIVVRNAA